MKVAVPLSGRAAYFYHLFSIVLLYLYDAITHGGRFWASSQDGTELLYIIDHNKGRWKPLICPPSTFPRNVACLLCFIRCGNCPDTLHLCPTCGFGWICLLNGKKKEKKKKEKQLHPSVLFIRPAECSGCLLIGGQDAVRHEALCFLFIGCHDSFLLGLSTRFVYGHHVRV